MKYPFIVSGLILVSVAWFRSGSANAQGAPPETRRVSDEAIPDDISIASNIRYREGAVRNWTLDLAMPKSAATNRGRRLSSSTAVGGPKETNRVSRFPVRTGPPGTSLILQDSDLWPPRSTIGCPARRRGQRPCMIVNVPCAFCGPMLKSTGLIPDGSAPGQLRRRTSGADAGNCRQGGRPGR